mgnify:CR=1 FL=1
MVYRRHHWFVFGPFLPFLLRICLVNVMLDSSFARSAVTTLGITVLIHQDAPIYLLDARVLNELSFINVAFRQQVDLSVRLLA